MASTIDEHTTYHDSSGTPLSGGSLFIGTVDLDPVANPKSIFSDRELTQALGNPQTLDSLGRTTNKIWLSGKYSVRVNNSAAVQSYIQLDNGTDPSTEDIFKLTSVSGSNTITASTGTSLASYSANQQFTFKTVLVNTGPVTLNVDAVGARAIVKNNDQPLVNGELAANQTVLVVYNATNDNFELVNPNAKVVFFSEGTPIVAAATTNIWATDGNTIHITGTTGITSFGTAPNVGARRTLIFDDVVTVTNSANLALPGGANFVTAAGDILHVYADTTTQFDVEITKKDGSAVTAAAVLGLSSVAGTNTITGTTAVALSAYVGNQQFVLETVAANTGPVTLNVNSIGAKAVVKNKDQPILASEFEDNQVVIVAYNATNDNFEWVNQNNKRLDTYEGGDVASAATTNIWSAGGNIVHVTGVTTITSFGTAPNVGATQRVVFDGVLLLTHSADLNLPGGVNYTTAAGDVALVYADSATQFDVSILKKDGAAVNNRETLILSGITGTNTLVASSLVALTAYPDGALFIFRTGAAANTAAVTLDVDSVGAKSVVKNKDNPIVAGEFALRQNVIVTYNAVDDTFEWVNQNNKVVDFYEGTPVVAAATTNIWSVGGNTIHITGSTGITSFGTAPNVGAIQLVVFDAGLTLTHSANLNLPGAVDFSPAAGDMALIYADTTTQLDVWPIKKDGTPIITASAAETVTTTSPSAAKPLTPAGFGGSKSLAADGYYHFPGGFLVQWGDVTVAGSSSAVTFPLTFTTVFSVAETVDLAQTHHITSLTTSGFTANNGGVGPVHRWIATGLLNS